MSDALMTKAEAARFLAARGYALASSAESKGAPGARMAVETWRRGTTFAAVLTQYLAGRESFSRVLLEAPL